MQELLVVFHAISEHRERGRVLEQKFRRDEVLHRKGVG